MARFRSRLLNEHSNVIANLAFAVASATDFEELVTVRIEAMRESLEQIGRFDPERARERFRNSFVPELTRHILLDGKRVGFFALKPDNNELLLDHFYIHPSHQRRGLGTEVLNMLFVEADKSKLPIRVGVLRDSASNSFYMQHGFQKTGESEWDIYYMRPPVHGCL